MFHGVCIGVLQAELVTAAAAFPALCFLLQGGFFPNSCCCIEFFRLVVCFHKSDGMFLCRRELPEESGKFFLAAQVFALGMNVRIVVIDADTEKR